MRSFITLLKPYRAQVMLSLILGVGTIIAAMGLMSLSGYLLSRAALRPPILELMLAITGVRFFGLSRAVLRYFERLVSHDLTFKLLMQIRLWFFGKLEPLAPARMKEHSGDLLSRIVADVDQLQTFYLRVMAPAIVAAIIISLTTVALWFVSAQIALITLLFLLSAGLVLPLWIAALARSTGVRQLRLNAALQRHYVDGIAGLPDVLIFGQQRRFEANIDRINQQLARLQLRQALISGMENSFNLLLSHLGMLAALLLALLLVIGGELNGIYLALLVLAVLTSFEAVQPLAQALQTYPVAKESMTRLQEITAAPELTTQGEQTPDVGEIRFEALSFAYESKRVLQDISFSLRPGERKAVVGLSGSGKSSLIKLLVRFYEPTQGHILLAGQDLAVYEPEALRRHIAVVSQDEQIFHSTLRKNLLIAKPGANDAELLRALEQARLADLLPELPQGLDTLLGEQGSRLSGGERRRLMLARAFLKDAPVVLLDEVTANLDAITEAEVMSSLKTLLSGRSALVLTHRLKQMDMFDEILVLKEGCIVERGRHHELSRQNGYYQRMLELQQSILQL